ncbi:unnamed protein product [Lampetra planeri]
MGRPKSQTPLSKAARNLLESPKGVTTALSQTRLSERLRAATRSDDRAWRCRVRCSAAGAAAAALGTTTTIDEFQTAEAADGGGRCSRIKRRPAAAAPSPPLDEDRRRRRRRSSRRRDDSGQIRAMPVSFWLPRARCAAPVNLGERERRLRGCLERSFRTISGSDREL